MPGSEGPVVHPTAGEGLHLPPVTGRAPQSQRRGGLQIGEAPSGFLLIGLSLSVICPAEILHQAQ